VPRASLLAIALLGAVLSASVADARSPVVRSRRRGLPKPDPAAIAEASPSTSRPPRYVPSRSLVHYMSARLAEGAGAPDVAIRELKLAAVYDQQSPFVRAELGAAYLRTGDRKRAEAAAKEALDLDDRHVPALLLLGTVALETGRVEVAVDWLRRASAEVPMRLDPAILLARAYLAASDLDAARLQADRVDVIASVADDTSGADPMRQHDAGQLMDDVADALAAKGRDTEAEELYRRAADRDPTWPERLRSWAAFLAARERHAEAAALHGRAFALALNDPADAANAALSLVKSGDPDAAALYVAPIAASESEPDRVAASLVPVAWRLLSAGRFPAARVAFEVALDKDPTRADAALGAGMACEAVSEPESALQAYARAAPGHVVWAQAMARAADLEARAGRVEDARRRLERVLTVAPNARDAWLGLARTLDAGGKAGDADTMRAGLLARQPHPEVVQEIVRALRARGDATGALLVLESVAGRFDVPALTLLQIQLLDDADRSADALVLARSLAGAHPESPGAANQLAWLLARHADVNADPAALEEAERLARRAVAADPNLAAYLDTLGYVLLLRDRGDEAVEVLARAAAGKDPEILYRYGDALRRLARNDEARRAYEEALARADPGATALRTRLEAALLAP